MAKYTEGPQWYAFPQTPNIRGVLVPDGVTSIMLGDVVDEEEIPTRQIFQKNLPSRSPVLRLAGVSETGVELELCEVAEEIDAFLEEGVNKLLATTTDPLDERSGLPDDQSDSIASTDQDDTDHPGSA